MLPAQSTESTDTDLTLEKVPEDDRENKYIQKTRQTGSGTLEWQNPTAIIRSPTEESWAVWEYKSPLTQLWKTDK